MGQDVGEIGKRQRDKEERSKYPKERQEVYGTRKRETPRNGKETNLTRRGVGVGQREEIED